MTQLNREYKSTTFAMLFSEKEALKSLCEAVSGEKIDSADDITINTLSDEDGIQSGICSRLKNDISFIFHGYQKFYEHQSTWAANMPIRMLLYYAELIRRDIEHTTLYSTKPLKLATPQFVVFYNGTDWDGDFDEMTMDLSEHFARKEEKPALELRVMVYNINKGHNPELMDACDTMRQYSEFVAMSRKALAGLSDEQEKQDAMERVLDQCLEQGILVDFIKKNRRAIMRRSILEFDEKACMKAKHDDGFDEGRAPLYLLVQKGRITIEEAAEVSELSVPEFEQAMTAAGYKLPNMV